jgi:DNA polymerase-3 subunit alpha
MELNSRLSGLAEGISEVILDKFMSVGKAKTIVGQNLGLTTNIIGSEFHRLGLEPVIMCAVLDCTESN